MAVPQYLYSSVAFSDSVPIASFAPSAALSYSELVGFCAALQCTKSPYLVQQLGRQRLLRIGIHLQSLQPKIDQTKTTADLRSHIVIVYAHHEMTPQISSGF